MCCLFQIKNNRTSNLTALIVHLSPDRDRNYLDCNNCQGSCMTCHVWHAHVWHEHLCSCESSVPVNMRLLRSMVLSRITPASLPMSLPLHPQNTLALIQQFAVDHILSLVDSTHIYLSKTFILEGERAGKRESKGRVRIPHRLPTSWEPDGLNLTTPRPWPEPKPKCWVLNPVGAPGASTNIYYVHLKCRMEYSPGASWEESLPIGCRCSWIHGVPSMSKHSGY